MANPHPLRGDYLPTLFLHKFPVEFWDECWSHGERIELPITQFNMSTVSPLVSTPHVSLPVFFGSGFGACHGRYWVDEARSLIKSASRFVHLANSEYRQMVQEWTFHGTFGVDDPDTSNMAPMFQSYLCAKETFVLTVPFYTNLRSLALWDIEVDVPLLNNLSLLQNLDFLHLSSCMLTDLTDHLMLLRNFRVDNWINTTPSLIPLHLILPLTLEILEISSHEAMQRLLPTLIADGTLKNLTHLHLCLPASIHDIFFDFLRECPHLQTITIIHPFDLVNHRDTLPLDAVPSLNVYEGPLDLAELLIVRCLVHTVRLKNRGLYSYGEEPVDMASLMSVFSRMSDATVALQHLGRPPMTPNLEVFRTINNLFPQIHALTMGFIGRTSENPSKPEGLGGDNDTLDGEDWEDDHDQGANQQRLTGNLGHVDIPDI